MITRTLTIQSTFESKQRYVQHLQQPSPKHDKIILQNTCIPTPHKSKSKSKGKANHLQKLTRKSLHHHPLHRITQKRVDLFLNHILLSQNKTLFVFLFKRGFSFSPFFPSHSIPFSYIDFHIYIYIQAAFRQAKQASKQANKQAWWGLVAMAFSPFFPLLLGLLWVAFGLLWFALGLALGCSRSLWVLIDKGGARACVCVCVYVRAYVCVCVASCFYYT